MTIAVRELGPEDWREWRQLRRAALADAAEAFGTSLAEWSGPGDTERRWRARLDDVPLNLLLFLDGATAAMVSATTPAEHGLVEIISLWVAPPYRGRGLGDAALRAVVAWAAERYPDDRVALSVRTGNEPAIRLYERHGFTDAGPSPDDPATERLMVR